MLPAAAVPGPIGVTGNAAKLQPSPIHLIETHERNPLTDSLPRILILDDEAEMRALLQRYLSGQGFAVQVVADAQQLDTLLARQGYDVLVLDLMLPGESGLSICRRLRASGETVPIMMLTARGDPVDRIVGLEMGADDYLPKPFEPRELAARLHAMIRRRAMDASGSAVVMDRIVRFVAMTCVVMAMVVRGGRGSGRLFGAFRSSAGFRHRGAS